MSDYVEFVLGTLKSDETFDSLTLSEKLSIDHQKIVGAIKSLQSLGDIIKVEQTSQTRWQLTAEGEEVKEKGSHEAVVFQNVLETGIKQDELMSKVGPAYGKIGFSKAMSLNWISIDKTGEGGPRVMRKVRTIEDKVKEQCMLVHDNKLNQLTDQQRIDLKKRKLINEIKLTSYVVSKGDNFTTDIEKQETDLTHEMIMNGSWKSKQFKPYNFSAKGLDPHGGHLHPLLKVRTQFRQIFLEMGFTEMPTNNFVESSFWNFDALFQPQQHPARDAHDTFFISDPEHAHEFPLEYMERVKKVHSEGGYGSLGYQYKWSELEASKNIMRTHTTAVSARMLYHLAVQPTFTPSKFFSIDRVFRNETLDATHLAEFHQIEGLVADRGLTLGHLMGYIQEFFKKYGIQKLKFKPAYNPYTEPSMEVFSYHEGLKKWVEIGNSGVFRPEMLLPMNLPPDVSVIAWGLSLERPTMIKYGIQNIRDLFGPKVDLQKIYDSSICRLGSDEHYITLTRKFPKETQRPVEINKIDHLSSHDIKMLEQRADHLINRLKKNIERLNDVNDKNSVQMLESNPNPKTAKDLTFISLDELNPDELNREYPTVDIMSDSRGIVIKCDPSYLPLSLIVILKDVLKHEKYVKSFIDPLMLRRLSKDEVKKLKSIFNYGGQDSPDKNSIVYIAWQDLGTSPRDVSMVIKGGSDIQSEIVVAKWLPSLINNEQIANLLVKKFYDIDNNDMVTKIDELVNECMNAYFSQREEEAVKKFLKDLDKCLESSPGPYIFTSYVTLADVFIWSLLEKDGQKLMTDRVKKWMLGCKKLWGLVSLDDLEMEQLTNGTSPLPLSLQFPGSSRGIAIYCDPLRLPLSLIIILKDILKHKYIKFFIDGLTLNCLNKNEIKKLKNIFDCEGKASLGEKSAVYIVWCTLGTTPRDVYMVIDGESTIQGETTVAKWLPNSLIEDYNPLLENFYSTLPSDTMHKIDELMDKCTNSYFPYDEETAQKFLEDLNVQLCESSGSYLFTNHVSLADVFIWSILTKREKNKQGILYTPKWMLWMDACDVLWGRYLAEHI